MTEALHAEWIKLRTFTSTGWLVAGTVTLTVAVSVRGRRRHPRVGGVWRRAGPTKLALVGIDLGQVVIAVLAVLMISGEYATGMIHVTLAFMPAASPSSQPMHSTSPGSPWLMVEPHRVLHPAGVAGCSTRARNS
jgi:hypothetical protein